jgi:predicted small secreted protein
MFRKAFNVAILATALASLVACNTVRGAGEDMESAADAVDNKT